MTNTTSRKVVEYVADTSDVLRKIGRIVQANQKMARNLGQDFTKSFKAIDQGIGKISKTEVFDSEGIKKSSSAVEKFSQTIKTADGSLAKYTETTKTNSKGVQSVTRSFGEMDKKTVSLGQNIARLASRAALTIPLWLALRGAIMGAITGIKNGVRDIVAFDKAIQKLKKNLQGTPEVIAKNFSQAKQSITDFSIASGKSTEEITKAIQRFATVGFDFETAMEAGVNATKLATILFGDAEKTANAFARSMNVLIDRTDKTRTASEQIAQAMALTSELYEINAFEVDELSAGLQKFAGTAKALNLTTEQTITLMGALSSQGLNPKRANIMRSSFLKLASSLDEVADKLGIKINPQLDTTFDVFRRVIAALADLKNESGKISPALFESVRDIFNIRGGEVALDFVAGFKEVNAQLDKFLEAKPDIGKFHQDFEDMNETVFRQVEIFDNLKKEFFKSFLTGIVGGEDFLDTMKKINVVMLSLQENAERSGRSLKALFTAGQVGAYVQSIDELKGTDLFGALFETRGFTDRMLIPFKAYAGELGAIYDEAFLQPALKKSEATFDDIAKALKGKLSKADIDELFIKIDKGDIDLGAVNIERLKQTIEEALEKDPIKASVQADIVGGTGKIIRSEADRQKLAEEILSSELERLKTLGASQSQLLETESSYVKILNLSREDEAILRKKLELERAIGEEKRLQSNLGSDSLKLAKIAQSEEGGVNVARQIGRVLEGDISFDVFKAMGGQALEIFKKEFSSKYEQQMAELFLTRGRGRSIPIAETGLRGGALAESQQRFQQQIQALNLQAKVDVNISAKLDPSNISDFADEVGRKVSQDMKTKGTEINESMNEGIDYTKLRRNL